MKKRISAIFTALLMTIVLCVPTLALNGLMEYVLDPDDLLTYEEWEALENEAAEITQRHDVGVYVVFVDDYSYYDYNDSGNVYETAETLYHKDSFGEGEGLDGILLLVSQYTRDYALYTYGAAEQAFDISELEDSFLSYLGDDDWYGGLDAYLVACDEALTRAETAVPTETGTSAEADTPAEPVSPVRGILTVVGISCVVALLICLALKGKMKTVHRKSEARQYTANGGLQLTERYDHYTHTTESRRRVEKKSADSGKSGGGGGGSGKF